MTHKNIKKAMMEARRFLAACEKMELALSESNQAKAYFFFGNKHTGAVRRASMDLTRALAEMRRP